MRRLLLALIATTVVWAGMSGSAMATDKPIPGQVHRSGRFLKDAQGRAVIIHGLNLVWKRAPYAPPNTAAGFTSKDADFLKRYGFNGARIGMLWAGVSPRKGVVDQTYFARWDRVLTLLENRGIYSLFDSHQDQWNELYGGEGAPAWATQRPLPYSAAPPVTAPFPQGYWTPELSTLFDNFWANKGGLLDAWAASWRAVARHYRDQPYSLGYDLMNEPWAGLEWPTCLTTGCPSSYPAELQPAYTKALTQIRSVDDRSMVWFEPQQFAGGQKLDSYYTPIAGERNLGFSWHNYCPDVFLESQGIPGGDVENCVAFTKDREDHAVAQANRMGAAALMTEWGATDNVRAIAIDAAGADARQMGWTYWAYKHWDDPTTADQSQGLFTNDADLTTIKRDKLRQLVRTYPQATAGLPTLIRFNPTTGRFVMQYRPLRNRGTLTRIFVSPLASRVYAVHVTHGHVHHRAGRYVWIQANSRRQVTVEITRRSGN